MNFLLKKNKALLKSCLASAVVLASQSALAIEDRDDDRIADVLDNCVAVANPSQVDSDGDRFGNACDTDLDNDGRTTELDLQLFETARELFLSQKGFNASADFNNDRRINEEDAQILELSLNKGLKPGPSALRFNEALADRPPRVEELSLFKVSGDVNPESSQGNAVVMVRFEKGQVEPGTVLTIQPDEQPLALNDLGLGADLEAQDGIFAAFVDVDFEGRAQDSRDFRERLNRRQDQTVKFFAGRSVIDRLPFEEQEPRNFSIREQVELSSGVTLIPVEPELEFMSLAASTDPAKTLGINDLSVVQDPSRTYNPCLDSNINAISAADGNVNGAWSFKTLMANMANTSVTGVSAQQFMHEWLVLWMNNQTVNNFTINARTNIQNFFPGWDGVNASTLDIDRLPFRLLAIMNRIDLGTTSLYGGASPGETRFVFGLMDPNSCSARPMTVILEYEDVTPACTDVKARANEWVALDSLPLPSPSYNAALQAITDQVTLANAAPAKPNGSAIGQVRSNDFAFSVPWQLREFRLFAGGPFLEPDTIKQTPHEPQYNTGGVDNGLLAEYIENEANDILCEAHSVPEQYAFSTGVQDFLTGHVDYNLGDFWNAPVNAAALPSSFPACYETTLTSTPNPADIPSEVLHKMSINTCDDCHSGETLTSFVHVNWSSNASFSIPANFSDFVTGNGGVGHFVTDPRGSGLTREFDEFARRGQILDDLATGSCGIRFNSLFVRNSQFEFVH